MEAFASRVSHQENSGVPTTLYFLSLGSRSLQSYPLATCHSSNLQLTQWEIRGFLLSLSSASTMGYVVNNSKLNLVSVSLLAPREAWCTGTMLQLQSFGFIRILGPSIVESSFWRSQVRPWLASLPSQGTCNCQGLLPVRKRLASSSRSWIIPISGSSSPFSFCFLFYLCQIRDILQ